MYNIKPFADSNAIKVVAFAVEFSNNVEAPMINEIVKLYNHDDNFKSSLPLIQPINVTTIQIVNGAETRTEAVGGVQFLRIKANGEVDMALKLQGNSLSIICQSYTTWEKVSSEVFGYFSKVIPSLKEQSINAITLEYIDEFNTDDKTHKWIDELFKKDSKYICAHVFDVDNFWHSHHGYFSNFHDGETDIRVLNTVNISSHSETNNITQEVQYKAVIKMQHKAESNNNDSL